MNEHESEVWKAIPGYEGQYEVSDQGRVKSLGRYEPLKKRNIKERILKPSIVVGYPHVRLCKNKAYTNYFIHTLVLLAFVGPRPDNQETLHTDGNRLNPKRTNLRYGTRKENYQDAIGHGTATRGERQGFSKLKERDVLLIRRYLQDGGRLIDIARHFNVAARCISHIRDKDSWAWLSQN